MLLIILRDIPDKSFMFYNCNLLEEFTLSLNSISDKYINNTTDMHNMFRKCSSLKILHDISNWNTSNVTDMSYMFSECSSLISLPDISNWNTSNVTNMSHMFSECSSLISLPDISKWNTSNVTNISYMFCECLSLSVLPDLSQWKTKNINNFSLIFYGCSSLISLPNISKWKIKNIKDSSECMCIIDNCTSLVFAPEIYNSPFMNAFNIYNKFKGCISFPILDYLKRQYFQSLFKQYKEVYGPYDLDVTEFWGWPKMIYNLEDVGLNKIRIFFHIFVEKNKKKCKLVYKNKLFPLQEFFPIHDIKRT